LFSKGPLLGKSGFIVSRNRLLNALYPTHSDYFVKLYFTVTAFTPFFPGT